MTVRELAAAVLLLLPLTACGVPSPGSMLNGSDPPGKTACPGDHLGFFVCLSSDSSISDKGLEQTILDGLGKVITLVNSVNFHGQVATAFAEGQSIDDSLAA